MKVQVFIISIFISLGCSAAKVKGDFGGNIHLKSHFLSLKPGLTNCSISSHGYNTVRRISIAEFSCDASYNCKDKGGVDLKSLKIGNKVCRLDKNNSLIKTFKKSSSFTAERDGNINMGHSLNGTFKSKAHKHHQLVQVLSYLKDQEKVMFVYNPVYHTECGKNALCDILEE